MHVVVINTGKSGVVPRIRAMAPGARVQVVTESSYTGLYAGSEVELTIVSDVGDVQEVLRAVLRIAAADPVTAVVSPSERSVPAGGYVRSMLGLPGTTVETALRFSHKGIMKSVLARGGLPVADHVQTVGRAGVERALRELGGPVVVKPVLGTGGMQTAVVRTPRELTDFWATTGRRLDDSGSPVVVERLVDVTNELHCDGVVVDGTVRFAAVQRYFMPLLGQIDAFTGSSFLAAGDPLADEVTKLHQRVVSTLGLKEGVTHLEVFETAEGLVVGEIACRPAGGGIVESIRLQLGVDLWEAFLAISLGLPVPHLGKGERMQPGIVVNCDLPTRPGRVLRITSADELAALPGVVRVEMFTTVGDVIGSRLHSASTTGLVYLVVEDETALPSALAGVRDAYVLETVV
ncbi:ATP-grasp domain-containing protein [Antribacter gilvus]|uniref:ATP-grasp domain-containing protein n=1 Tax=Antribacter gilvus TaxID=2304675 RepID=UPI001F0CCEA2|nr:ATP-grasp domain-containing protein [Antribacter gilvus]